ncbi:YitT family protein [Latilactobacillus curvatus]|uniref:YitT family protein n=1 Tax=Latilactobacillus curvatus TaxID=28038 RepID=UPI000C1C2F18|nr:YitT family protein [Latilactobacillus curvatus]MCP8869466.1 YitT family protein [Latilactobacillus curvatus]MCS6142102.1 YitT family protein [Latilactobacillus curvatus]MCS8581960.1 YitT family protein [Latilactobacillus curvatus]MCS8606180.1 YitT family protein [Latilactobacillus curvatus]MCT3359452.1 YitT family protein [Latilactobacillus curvatus]
MIALKGNSKKIIIAMVYGFLAAVSVNLFLIPAKTYSSGVTGIAQLLTSLVSYMGGSLSVAMLVFILNVPLLILAWFKINHQYAIFSIVAVFTSVLFLKVIPVPVHPIVTERFAGALFGGALIGLGVGLCFKAGFSTGGTDVIVTLVGRLTGKRVGVVNNIINGMIILAAGIFFGWGAALYSIVEIFVSSLLMDYIYIQQQKVTVTIFTKRPEELKKRMHDFIHGATELDGTGLYTNQETTVIMTVVSKYDLTELKRVVKDADPNAFVNIQSTMNLWGKFENVE